MEELREAVEMLNDTVRERGRSQSHDQAIQELMSKVRRGDFRYIYIYITHTMAVNELIGPRQATTPPHMCFFVLFQFTLGLRKKKKKYTF